MTAANIAVANGPVGRRSGTFHVALHFTGVEFPPSCATNAISISYWATRDQLSKILSTSAPGAICVRLGESVAMQDAAPALEAVAREYSVPRIVAVLPTRLSTADLTELLWLARINPDIQILPPSCTCNEFVQGVQNADKWRRMQVATITCRLAREVTAEQLALIVPALTIGHSKSTPQQLATACGMSGRTLRRMLKVNGLPNPAKVLGLVAGLSFSYRSEHLTESIARAAFALGFEHTDDFRRYLRRRTGISPTGWKKLRCEQSILLIGSTIRVRPEERLF